MAELASARSDWFVYLVRTRQQSLYCGITKDVERRFAEHVRGVGAKALKGKGPLQLAWHERVANTRGDAQRVELLIKRQSKIVKERLVRGEITLQALMS
ncbi:GIY-YIG nuclease family protein [Vibrio sp.]|uniref:GIY-YIG nuclease family protein n=1 Tax=Vibrio sp. TaxID=678 RepID=UPI003D13A4D5